MVNARRRLWIASALLVVYWLALFTATHWPAHRSHKGIPGVDKGEHYLAYLGLGLLLACVLQRGPRPTWPRYVAVLLIGAGYGAIDELTQTFVPGRMADAFDWLADIVGTACGLVIHRIAAMFLGGFSPAATSKMRADQR
jgi:VanZ family protein